MANDELAEINNERAFITKLLTQNLAFLCRNSLPSGAAVHVDALVGVTLSNQQVILVNVSKSLLAGDEENIDFDDGAVKDADYSSTVSRWPETLSEKPTSADVKPDLEAAADRDSRSLTVTTDWDEIDDDDCVVVKQEISDGYNSCINDDECQYDDQQAEMALPPEAFTGEDPGEFDAEDVNGSYFIDESMTAKPTKCQKMTGRPLKLGINQKLTMYPTRTRCKIPALNNSRKIRHRIPSSSTDCDLGFDCRTMAPVTYDTSAVSPLTVFRCPFCGLHVRTHATLQDHIHGKHMEMYNFPCKACGESFRWRSSLSNHRRVCPMAGVMPENT